MCSAQGNHPISAFSVPINSSYFIASLRSHGDTMSWLSSVQMSGQWMALLKIGGKIGPAATRLRVQSGPQGRACAYQGTAEFTAKGIFTLESCDCERGKSLGHVMTLSMTSRSG